MWMRTRLNGSILSLMFCRLKKRTKKTSPCSSYHLKISGTFISCKCACNAESTNFHILYIVFMQVHITDTYLLVNDLYCASEWMCRLYMFCFVDSILFCLVLFSAFQIQTILYLKTAIFPPLVKLVSDFYWDSPKCREKKFIKVSFKGMLFIFTSYFF